MEKKICNTKKEGKTVKILSPSVGIFSTEIENETFLCPGNYIGTISSLNIRKKLFLPHNVSGKVTIEDSTKREIKVDYGQTLLTISTEKQTDEIGTPEELKTGEMISEEEMIVKSFITGIFYRRETPDTDPFVMAGSEINRGDTLGLIEVMKSFNRIIFENENNFEYGIVEEIYLEDNSEVKKGDPLFRISLKRRK